MPLLVDSYTVRKLLSPARVESPMQQLNMSSDWKFACLAFLCVLSLAVAWHQVVETFALSLQDDEYTHILLILPVSASLLFVQWRSIRTAASPGILWGSILLAAAAVFVSIPKVWSAWLPPDLLLTVGMFALALSLIGSFILCLGTGSLRVALFPLLFLFGMVPLPHAVVDEAVLLLQLSSAWAAQLLFVVCGVPVSQEGIVLNIPGLTLVVAHECSSIRSSSMLLVTTMVLAHIVLRSRWRQALVIGLAVPLSIAKNSLRIFTIAMLGTRVDPGYLTGKLHHEGGIIFFAIVLLLEFGMFWILRRGDDPAPSESPSI